MQENKHTPGPWEVSHNTFVDGESHGIYAYGELDQKGFQIAIVNGLPTMDKEATEETGKANAALIAAAPALLEEATRLREQVRVLREALTDLVNAHDLKMGTSAVKLRVELAQEAITQTNPTE